MSDRGVSPPERRRSTRLEGDFPVRVRGVDALGRSFDVTSLVDNISAGGLHLTLLHSVGKGARLFAVVQLPGGATVAARGTVLREERWADFLLGLASSFTSARLLKPRLQTDSAQLEDGSCLSMK